MGILQPLSNIVDGFSFVSFLNAAYFRAISEFDASVYFTVFLR